MAGYDLAAVDESGRLMGRWDVGHSVGERWIRCSGLGFLELYVISDLSSVSPFDSRPRAVSHAAQLSALSGPCRPPNADVCLVGTAPDGSYRGRRSRGRRPIAGALTRGVGSGANGLFGLLMAGARCGLRGFLPNGKGLAWRASDRRPPMSYRRFPSCLSTRSQMCGLRLRVPRPMRCAAARR